MSLWAARPEVAATLQLVDSGELLEAEAVEGDEAGGVVLVVSFFLAAFHGGDVFVVEAVRRTAAGVDDVAFVKLHADFAVDCLLGLGDEGLESIALWGEPEAVVNELGVVWDEAVAEVLGILAVLLREQPSSLGKQEIIRNLKVDLFVASGGALGGVFGSILLKIR